MVSGQWSVVSGQWSVVSGQWSGSGLAVVLQDDIKVHYCRSVAVPCGGGALVGEHDLVKGGGEAW